MAQKQGGKNRKYGRCKKSPSHATYNALKKDVTNKQRKAAKLVKLQAKLLKTPHGTLRKHRRSLWQQNGMNNESFIDYESRHTATMTPTFANVINILSELNVLFR